MGLFSNPGIVGDELQKCLAYYEASFSVTAFQTREADLFNNTLVKYLNAVTEDPVAAREVCNAANRLVQAAKEIIRRHEGIQSVPEAAFSLHQAYRITFLAHAAWAEATLSAMEALSDDITPHYQFVQHLLGQCQSASCKAQTEDRKFLKRLRVSADIIEKMINRCNIAGASDSWQPDPNVYDLSRREKPSENRRDTGACYNRGLPHGDTAEYDRVIFDQTKAIEANPQSPGVGRNYFLRGTAYHNKGQYDQAIDDYSNAIKWDAMFLDWLAKPCHIAWGEETQRAIQLNPETEEAFRADVIKNTHQRQRYPFDYYYRAGAYYAKGEYDRAILDYNKTIEIDPCMGAAHFQLAKVYLKVGNKDLALERYEILKTLDEELAEDLLDLIRGRSRDASLISPSP